MNLLHAEAVNALKPPMSDIDPPLSFEEITKSLGKELVAQCKSAGISEAVLEEFVFALDHLHELGGLPNFPNNRLLNTPDIVAGGCMVVRAFNGLARHTGGVTPFGVAINARAMESIEEFFNYKYLNVIAQVLQALRVLHSLNFKLDGVSTQLSLSFVSAHPEFGVLTYINVRDEITMMIPFHVKRIADVH